MPLIDAPRVKLVQTFTMEKSALKLPLASDRASNPGLYRSQG